jgi:ABC-type sugar transport system ATPase subunit
MDSDRILVVDEGKTVEFDSPATLIDREGLFSALVNGSPNASFLRGIALGERNVLEALEVELEVEEGTAGSYSDSDVESVPVL